MEIVDFLMVAGTNMLAFAELSGAYLITRRNLDGILDISAGLRQCSGTLYCLLSGWSLDAFDFFILTFCVSAIATQFQTKISDVAEAIFITLAFRPVGAFLSD